MSACSMGRLVIAFMLLLLASIPGLADSADRDLERTHFREGWAAAQRGDQASLVQAIAQLPDYPLTPYLQHELLRQRVDQVPPAVMTQFLARYRDWSFRPQLERSWLRSLGRRNQHELLLAHGQDSEDSEVRCHLAQARLALNQTEGLEAQVRSLWLVGRSQHKACDAVFDWWRSQGNPDAATAWRRFDLAIAAGEQDLARYLKRFLPRAERELADHWLAMVRNPVSELRQARHWHDVPEAQRIVRFGLDRLAVNDWAAADKAWQVLRYHFSWPESEAQAIARRIALFQAVALDGGALAAIDALPAEQRDDQILAWRVRAALGQQQWDEVLAGIEAMSVSSQLEGRWRYWRARALAAQGRPEAALAYASLAAEASYYGFLSATVLDQPLSLCEEAPQAGLAVQQRLLRDSEVERMLELLQVGLGWHARSQWQRLNRRLGREEKIQLGLLAAAQGQDHLAILAMMEAGARRAYPWRFPLAEKDLVLTQAARWQVDPALIWGLMRAESAMQPDARSGAGALGLLQLMPDTARVVSRRKGLPFPQASSLLDPAINIPLGVAHLGELQEELDDNWPRVTAAYNAGKGALQRWLDERPQTPADIWVETLPYYETRDYVAKVLTFATIYEWRLSRRPEVLARHILGRNEPAGGFACPP